MVTYCVNNKALQNGKHEDHKSGCSRLPSFRNRIFLGDFLPCFPALPKTKEVQPSSRLLPTLLQSLSHGMKRHRRHGLRALPHCDSTPLLAPWSSLATGFQITRMQLQGRVEIGYQTGWTQALTTIWCWGPFDHFSCRVLSEVLDAIKQDCHHVTIPAFAEAARDLFRHASKTLCRRSWGRVLRRLPDASETPGKTSEVGAGTAN